MQTKRIIINSKDRDYNLSRSSSDFVVNLNNNLLQQVNKLTVESVTITNVIYNVPQNTNIYWTEGIGGQIYNKTLPYGSYTLTEFMDELKNQLNSIGSSTFDVYQDLVTKRIVINNPSFSFTIYSYSTINHILGVPSNVNSSSTLTAPYVLNCPYVPNLGGEDILYIHSKALAEFNSVTSSSASSSILTYISFFQTAFGGTYTNFNNDYNLELIEFSIPRDLTTIDIKVRNKNGEIVDLQNTDVVIILKFYLNGF